MPCRSSSSTVEPTGSCLQRTANGSRGVAPQPNCGFLRRRTHLDSQRLERKIDDPLARPVPSGLRGSLRFTHPELDLETQRRVSYA
jgi:hypothetical protein